MSSENASTLSSDDMTSAKPVLPILIVDDDLVILDMLRAVLQDEGFTVVTANNAVAALHLLQRTRVACVLTDLMMPGLSGLELADHLHSELLTTAIPVLLMSAFLPLDVGTRVVSVIEKPFALDDLLDILRPFRPH
jgi:CheY-like chemotaxis protein